MQPIRVLIVAPDPLARAGLATWLAADELCQIAGLADASSAEWLDAVALFQPDVVLYDGGWQGGAEWLELSDVGAPVVVLATDAKSAAEARAAGARGVVERENSAETILSALLAVTHHLSAFQPDWLPATDAPGVADAPARPLEPLTPREAVVLNLLAEGLTNKAIGHRLGISEHTVKFHVNAILDKLAAQSRAEAVMRAAKLGLLPL